MKKKVLLYALCGSLLLGGSGIFALRSVAADSPLKTKSSIVYQDSSGTKKVKLYKQDFETLKTVIDACKVHAEAVR